MVLVISFEKVKIAFLENMFINLDHIFIAKESIISEIPSFFRGNLIFYLEN